jgi:hypothetical protein
MPGQTIGTVNVQVGPQSNPRVTTLTYGSRTLKSATDLDMSGVKDGDVIVYKASTDSFIMEPVEDTNLNIDNGFF